MSMNYKEEKTLVIVKPDGVQRSLVGEIIKRFEQVGLKILGMKMLVPDSEKIESHYLADPNWKKNVGEKSIEAYNKKGVTPPSSDPEEVGEIVLKSLVRYVSSGPVLAIVLEGAHAVPLVRKIVGGTEPLSSDVGTIRGDYVLDSYQMADSDGRAVRNLIHASGSVEEAEKEISIWFDDTEIVHYNMVQDKILYNIDIDGILK